MLDLMTTRDKEIIFKNTKKGDEYLDFNFGIYALEPKAVRTLIKNGKVTNKKIIRHLETNPIPKSGTDYRMPSLKEVDTVNGKVIGYDEVPLGSTILGQAVLKGAIENLNETKGNKININWNSLGKIIPWIILIIVAIVIVYSALTGNSTPTKTVVP